MWLTVVAWRALAEQVSTYMKKGALVLGSGRLSICAYTNKENVEKTSVEVIASDVRFLEPKPKESTTEREVE